MEEGLFDNPTGIIFKKYYILYDVFSKENLSFFLVLFLLKSARLWPHLYLVKMLK